MSSAPLLPDPEIEPTVALWPTAARAMGIGRSSAFSHATTGNLPFSVIRVGGQLRVPTAELRALLCLPAKPYPVADIELEAFLPEEGGYIVPAITLTGAADIEALLGKADFERPSALKEIVLKMAVAIAHNGDRLSDKTKRYVEGILQRDTPDRDVKEWLHQTSGGRW